MNPRLVVEPMTKWQSRILNFVGYLVGLRHGSVAWIEMHVTLDAQEEEDFEVTINDLKRMHEEDKMNRQREKETGE